MPSGIPDAKRAIRARVRADLARMSPGERAAGSERARVLLTSRELWREAKNILFFAPLHTELDIWPLLGEVLASGKSVALPRFDTAARTYAACEIKDLTVDLVAGQFGIREPNETCSIISQALDLILVPGVAFDLKGGRLGRGAGYYDRLLANVAGTRCAVAFDQQIVDELPVETHDLGMDYILTPSRWIRL